MIVKDTVSVLAAVCGRMAVNQSLFLESSGVLSCEGCWSFSEAQLMGSAFLSFSSALVPSSSTELCSTSIIWREGRRMEEEGRERKEREGERRQKGERGNGE